jgi:hypothetical protein
LEGPGRSRAKRNGPATGVAVLLIRVGRLHLSGMRTAMKKIKAQEGPPPINSSSSNLNRAETRRSIRVLASNCVYLTLLGHNFLTCCGLAWLYRWGGVYLDSDFNHPQSDMSLLSVAAVEMLSVRRLQCIARNQSNSSITSLMRILSSERRC